MIRYPRLYPLAELMSSLSPEIARDFQERVENAALGTHLMEDEIIEILDDIVDAMLTTHQLSDDAELLLDLAKEAVLAKYYPA